MTKTTSPIIEKQLHIPGDYQYQALTRGSFFQSNWHQNKWFVVGRLLGLYHPQTALDLGTGSGNFELTFAPLFNKIVGVDYNNEALDFLRRELNLRHLTHIKLVCHDIEKLSSILPSLGKFDLIITVDVIEHLHLSAHPRLISSLKQLLNPGGKIIIITPNYRGLWPLVETFMDLFHKCPHLADTQHVTKFNRFNLHTLFVNAGFRQVNFGTFNTFSFIFPLRFLSHLALRFELALNLPFGSLLFAVFQAGH